MRHRLDDFRLVVHRNIRVELDYTADDWHLPANLDDAVRLNTAAALNALVERTVRQHGFDADTANWVLRRHLNYFSNNAEISAETLTVIQYILDQVYGSIK